MGTCRRDRWYGRIPLLCRDVALTLLRIAIQVLLYLLRRCYGLCYRLMASSEPVSEELMPIANVSFSRLHLAMSWKRSDGSCSSTETEYDQAVSQ